MNLSLSFFFNSALLGAGLAMDALSVSIANGLNEPNMRRRKGLAIAATFAFFQWLMPMLGWFCIHFLVEAFSVLRPFIPWISLLLLLYIGGEMLLDGIRNGSACETGLIGLSVTMLLLQGIATSIDALSVGFTIASYSAAEALLAAVIIAVVTFLICLGGLSAGKRIGMFLCSRAKIIGGCILILIGLEIFLTGIF